MELHFLGFDVGGTKTAWGLLNEKGKLLDSGRFPTPKDDAEFLASLNKIIDEKKPLAVGIGIAGTITANHQDVIVCPNIPSLSHIHLTQKLKETHNISVGLDNDARCALIGEIWMGSAKDMSSAVMLTLGTGVGGAVMQKGVVLPHPQDLSMEIGRIMVDPHDPFPAISGAGTVEAFLGGRNLERRFEISMKEISTAVRKKDAEAIEIWEIISFYFTQVIQAVYANYSCKNILVGGIGSEDLEYYKEKGVDYPCPVLKAELGELAGLYGAARIAIDTYTEDNSDV